MARKKKVGRKPSVGRSAVKKSAKKQPVKKAGKKEKLYVGVTQPVDIRRHILEASRDMLGFMQHYERFKEVRKEQKESLEVLRMDVHESRMAFKKLRKLLPSIKKHKEKKRIVKVEKPVEEPQEVRAPVIEKKKTKLKKTELDKLEAELNDIEQKLETLS